MTTLPKFGTSYERQLWVISTLKLAGTSIAEVAREHGIARTALDSAFYRPSDRAEKIMAAAVSTAIMANGGQAIVQQELFPERYNEIGQRIFRVRRVATATAA